MSLKNFLPLRREVMDHWVYKDSDFLKIWIEILFRARFSEETKKDIHKGSLYEINYSEFLFSRTTWSNRLGINSNKLYKCIKNLERENMITKVGRVGKGGATIFRVCNYEKYNKATALSIDNEQVECNDAQLSNNFPTTFQQLNNKEATLKKNVKNVKNVKTEDIDSHFEKYWKQYPLKKGKGSVSGTQRERLYKLGDELGRCIERYLKYVESEDWLKFQNGSTFFNSGYVDYLDKNYIESKVEISDFGKPPELDDADFG